MVAKGHLNLVKYVSCYELAVNDMIVCCSPALPPSLAKILMIVILIIIYGSVFEILTINIELTTKIGEKFLNVRTKFGNDFPNFSFLYPLGVMTISVR